MADTNLFERGMATRRSVLGDSHVDGATAHKTDFDDVFQTFITEGAWGSVWSRPGLSKRERSMITLALLAALLVALTLTPALCLLLLARGSA